MGNEMKYWLSGVFCGVIITFDVLINLAMHKAAKKESRKV